MSEHTIDLELALDALLDLLTSLLIESSRARYIGFNDTDNYCARWAGKYGKDNKESL